MHVILGLSYNNNFKKFFNNNFVIKYMLFEKYNKRKQKCRRSPATHTARRESLKISAAPC